MDWNKVGAFGAGALNDTLFGIPEAILSKTNPDFVDRIKSQNPDAYANGKTASILAGAILPGMGIAKLGKAALGARAVDEAVQGAKAVTRSEKIAKILGGLMDDAKVAKPTKAFEASKLLEGDIKPISMFHGTTGVHDILDPDKAHGMIWTTDNPEYAKIFSGGKKPMSVNVYPKKQLDMSMLEDEYSLEEWKDILTNKGVDISDIPTEKLNWAPEYGKYTFFDLLPHAGNNYIDAGVIKKIKNAGFDSIKAPIEINDGIKSSNNIVILNKDKIKTIPSLEDKTPFVAPPNNRPIKPNKATHITDIIKKSNYEIKPGSRGWKSVYTKDGRFGGFPPDATIEDIEKWVNSGMDRAKWIEAGGQ